MKLRASYMVEVMYMGELFHVPNSGWLATDWNGHVYWYDMEPMYHSGKSSWVCDDAAFFLVAEFDVDDQFNPAKSLLEIPE